jgi:hypothetical protein
MEAVTAPLPAGPFVNVFAERERLFGALRTGEGLEPFLARMLRGALAAAVLYGAVLGVQIGGWQVLSSPVKLPLILLGTALLCFGALYVLVALAGERLHWRQVAGLALCGVSASSLCMAGLLPLAAFWTHVAQPDRQVVTLLHSAAFLVSGTIGSRFALQAARQVFVRPGSLRVMLAWMWLYGLVAQQMAWMFRPHFTPTSVFMRPLDSGGSALESLVRIVLGWLR